MAQKKIQINFLNRPQSLSEFQNECYHVPRFSHDVTNLINNPGKQNTIESGRGEQLGEIRHNLQIAVTQIETSEKLIENISALRQVLNKSLICKSCHSKYLSKHMHTCARLHPWSHGFKIISNKLMTSYLPNKINIFLFKLQSCLHLKLLENILRSCSYTLNSSASF